MRINLKQIGLQTETDRLQFILDRDGLEEALSFAERTLIIYRRHVIGKYCTRENRRAFVCSYLDFKRFIKQANNLLIRCATELVNNE
jgi:hypothetical protein